MKDILSKFFNTQNFKDIEKIIKNETAHSFLLSSPDNFSNMNLSLCMAIYYLCNNRCCLNCENCAKILKNSHLDLTILPEKDAFLTEDATKIIENAFLQSISGNKKVFILNNFHTANVISQNKILKIIEEPPENTIFIINTNNLDLILPTIKSRCIKFALKEFKEDELKSFFASSNINALEFADGWIGKAQQIINDKKYSIIVSQAKNIITKLKTSGQVLKFSTESVRKKDEFVDLLTILEKYFREMLMYKQGQKVNLSLEIVEVINEYSSLALMKIIKKINQSMKEYKSNVSSNIILDNLLMGILEAKYICK